MTADINIKSDDELTQAMQDTMLKLQSLIVQKYAQQADFFDNVKAFLLKMVSSVIDSAETNHPGSASIFYADIEAAMKAYGLQEISARLACRGTALYSADAINENDTLKGMAYIGQQLAITLFQSLGELPKPLRNQEMVLRGVEVLLVNLLNHNFMQNAHQVLDRLCEQAHLILDYLTAKKAMH